MSYTEWKDKVSDFKRDPVTGIYVYESEFRKPA